VTGGRALHAEVLKLLSLPGTYFTLLGTLGVSVILAIAFSRQGVSPVGYAQAGFIVLGVIAVTSEYSGGQIHRTLTALPRRIALHLSKMAALLIVAVPAAGLTALVCGPLSEAAGASAYLALTTVLAAAVATVLRRSVPAVAGLLGYYFIAGPLLRDRAAFAAYLPDLGSHHLVVLGWVLLAVGVSAMVFRRRDA